MTIAIQSQGTELSVSQDGGSTYIDLGCVIDGFSGPGGSKPEIDVTTLCSPGQEFIDGLPDFGSISFTGLYNPNSAACQTLMTLYKGGRSNVDWKITFSDAGASTWTFKGYVSEFSVSFQKNEAVRLSGAIRVSGVITEDANDSSLS